MADNDEYDTIVRLMDKLASWYGKIDDRDIRAKIMDALQALAVQLSKLEKRRVYHWVGYPRLLYGDFSGFYPRYNIAPSQDVPVIERNELKPMRRGLVPSWWKPTLHLYGHHHAGECSSAANPRSNAGDLRRSDGPAWLEQPFGNRRMDLDLVLQPLPSEQMQAHEDSWLCYFISAPLFA
jgi:putative SOS response-associated peptidase YedK